MQCDEPRGGRLPTPGHLSVPVDGHRDVQRLGSPRAPPVAQQEVERHCLRKLGGALEAADQAIKLDPRLGIAYYNRASALAALGERVRARGDLQTVFQVDSGRNLRRAAAEALEILEKG
jgi:tetratricopeptide (TPR) repeat protein